MPRHDLVEDLNFQQHPGRLRTLLDRLLAGQITEILETLPSKTGGRLGRNPRRLSDAIRERVSDDVREELVAVRPQQGPRIMLDVLNSHNSPAAPDTGGSRDELAALKPIWIDLVAPTERCAPGSANIRPGTAGPDRTHHDLKPQHVLRRGQRRSASAAVHDMEEQSRNVAVASVLHRAILSAQAGGTAGVPPAQLPRAPSRAT